MWEKLSQRWEMYTSLTEGLLSLSDSLLFQHIQLTSRWFSVEGFAFLFI